MDGDHILDIYYAKDGNHPMESDTPPSLVPAVSSFWLRPIRTEQHTDVIFELSLSPFKKGGMIVPNSLESMSC